MIDGSITYLSTWIGIGVHTHVRIHFAHCCVHVYVHGCAMCMRIDVLDYVITCVHIVVLNVVGMHLRSILRVYHAHVCMYCS